MSVWKILLLALGFASCSAAAGVASERNIDGFQSAKWGMTKEEVRRAVSAVDYSQKIDNKTIAAFGLPTYDVDGCPFSLSFGFANDRLTSATLLLRDDHQSVCRIKIPTALAAKYGAPGVHESKPTSGSENETRQ
jgi:hypothetical protein